MQTEQRLSQLSISYSAETTAYVTQYEEEAQRVFSSPANTLHPLFFIVVGVLLLVEDRCSYGWEFWSTLGIL